jgi:hypothetical protein
LKTGASAPVFVSAAAVPQSRWGRRRALVHNPAMNLSLIQRLGAALVLATVAAQAVADDNLEQLRAENVRLRAQLQQLQQSCPVAAATPAPPPVPAATKVATTPAAPPLAAMPASPAAPATSAAATPAPPAPAAAVVPAPAPPAAVQVQPGAAPASPASVASVPVPAGYKLVPVGAPDYVDPLSPPYDHAGCSRGAFQGPPPAKWNDASNWDGMRRGLKMDEVNDLLGKEHFDASGRDRIEWQYGKCGNAVSGRVQFIDGQVVYWQVPAL